MEYLELIEKVKHGARFTIDFKKRTLRVNGKEADAENVEYEFCNVGGLGLMESIEILYHEYKHSVPSPSSEHRQHTYFKALPYEQITTWDLCYREHREVARFKLEFFVLKAIMEKRLVWHDDWGSWFWQSDDDKDLIILREWIEPPTKSY